MFAAAFEVARSMAWDEIEQGTFATRFPTVDFPIFIIICGMLLEEMTTEAPFQKRKGQRIRATKCKISPGRGANTLAVHTCRHTTIIDVEAILWLTGLFVVEESR